MNALGLMRMDGRALDADQFAWDGGVQWLGMMFDKPVQTDLAFEVR